MEKNLRLQRIWKCMKQRCNNPKNTTYKNYGGRGIKVCEEWTKFKPFEKWALENGYQDDLTIDRIDVNGNYEPSNCRWISFLEQQYNKRKTIYFVHKNKKYNLLELSGKLGLSITTIRARIKRGFDENNISKQMVAKKIKKYLYNNKLIDIVELSKQTNIPTKVLYQRIDVLGWSIEKAINTPKCNMSSKIKLYDYNGKKMCIAEISKIVGIKRTTLNYRLSKCNYDINLAINNDLWRAK